MTIPTSAYISALGAMHDRPKGLLVRAEIEAGDYGGGEVSEGSLLDYLAGANPNDPLRQNLGLRLAKWDAASSQEWSQEPGGTTERRQTTYDLLGLGDELRNWLTTHYPPHDEGTIIITSDEWDPWYSADKRQSRFYWDAYEKYLRDLKKWPSEAVQDLDSASDQIVERLADPMPLS